MKKTFLLILLVVLAGIVLWYMFPMDDEETEQLMSENDIRMIEHAVTQYVIDGYSLNGIPKGKSSAMPICVSDPCPDSQFDLSRLVPIYINATQTDSDELRDLTQYRIYKEESSMYACDSDRDDACGD